MADNPNNTSEVLSTVRQQRLENAVEELMAAKDAGTLGKPREQPSRAEAHENNEDTLQSEFADATAPAGQEDGQPPLIANGPGEQTLISTDPHLSPKALQAGIKFADAALSAAGENTHKVVTLGVKAVQNAVEATRTDGDLRAKGVAFVGMMGIDMAQELVGGEDPSPAGQSATDDTKGYYQAVTQAKLGGPAPSSDEQGPLIR
jgi:hypothetical protein